MDEKYKVCVLCKDLQVVGMAGVSMSFLACKMGTNRNSLLLLFPTARRLTDREREKRESF